MADPNQHRQCGTCRFRRRPASMDLSQLECARYPPTAQMAATPRGPVVMPVWPPVLAEEVCGEWRDENGPRRRLNHHPMTGAPLN